MSHAWTCPSLFVHCHGNAKFGIRDCPHVSAVEFSPCTSTPRIGNCSLYWAWTMNTHRKKFSSLHAEILDIDGKNSSPSPRRNQITLKLQLEGSLIRSDPSSRCSISQSYRWNTTEGSQSTYDCSNAICVLSTTPKSNIAQLRREMGLDVVAWTRKMNILHVHSPWFKKIEAWPCDKTGRQGERAFFVSIAHVPNSFPTTTTSYFFLAFSAWTISELPWWTKWRRQMFRCRLQKTRPVSKRRIQRPLPLPWSTFYLFRLLPTIPHSHGIAVKCAGTAQRTHCPVISLLTRSSFPAVLSSSRSRRGRMRTTALNCPRSPTSSQTRLTCAKAAWPCWRSWTRKKRRWRGASRRYGRRSRRGWRRRRRSSSSTRWRLINPTHRLVARGRAGRSVKQRTLRWLKGSVGKRRG